MKSTCYMVMLAAAEALAPTWSSGVQAPTPGQLQLAGALGVAAAHQVLGPAEFVAAARRGDENAIRKSLERNPNLLNSTDAMGLTALDWAATREHWPIFRQLLAAGADWRAVGFDGGTVLHRLAHHDQPQLIRLLLDAGADPRLQNQWGRTALHVAARRGQLEVAKMLLAGGADLELGTREGWTPLHVAYRSGQPEMVEWLVAVGADQAAKDQEGKTPVEHLFRRPQVWQEKIHDPWAYQGHYQVNEEFHFTVRWADGNLTLEDFSTVALYPTGPDAFFTRLEPWAVKFSRDPAGRVTNIQVQFLRRAETGMKVDDPEYVGSGKCAECHASGDGGAPYVPWLRSRHASAFWRLETDWARFLAAQRPYFKDLTDPATDSRCLICHTTAALEDTALFAESFRRDAGVGCEACHGPGSKYASRKIMGDRDAFLAAGGRIPDEKTCQACHRNPETFSFDEWWPRIAHGDRPSGSGR